MSKTRAHQQPLAEVVASFGEAGQRLKEIAAVEAAAGNISACLGWPVDLGEWFDERREVQLPLAVPSLAGFTVVVSGSGCRLRDLAGDPWSNLGAIEVAATGRVGLLHFRSGGNFVSPTLELNSHLAVHASQVADRKLQFHSIIHAQPPHLTLLSHIPEYQSTARLNAALIRWEAETLVALPEGVGFLPFMLPGSVELATANAASLRQHQVVLWAKHGVMSRSDRSVLAACDLIEYAETAARYEYLNLTIGSRAEGLSREELARVVGAYGVNTNLLDD